MLPILIEAGLTVAVFLFAFQYYFSIVGMVTIVSFLLATYYLQEWRNVLFRDMKIKDNIFCQHANDSLLNF